MTIILGGLVVWLKIKGEKRKVLKLSGDFARKLKLLKRGKKLIKSRISPARSVSEKFHETDHESISKEVLLFFQQNKHHGEKSGFDCLGECSTNYKKCDREGCRDEINQCIKNCKAKK